MNTLPTFSTPLEAIIYHIADVRGGWEGDVAYECGVFSVVCLGAQELAILDFIIPKDIEVPHFWVVQKYPALRVIPFDKYEDIERMWLKVLLHDRTEWSFKLFDADRFTE